VKALVLVVGDGLLAEFVMRELSATCKVVHHTDLSAEVPDGVDLALVLHDAWQPAMYQQAEAVFQPLGVKWLRGFVSLGDGVIGPLVRPGTPGCSQCADLRRLMASSDRQDLYQIEQGLATRGRILRDAWGSRLGLMQMTQLIVTEARRVLDDSPAQTEDHVYFVNLKTLNTTRHHILANPLCSVCGQVPDDTPEAANISLEPNPKVSRDSYRMRKVDDLKTVLVRDYLDYRTGLLNARIDDLASPFAVVTVNLPLMGGNEGTAGRTLSYEESELTAILEGLERYCGLSPRSKRTVVVDSFQNLGHQALNPLTVGVHAPEHYALPNFPFRPFDPERPTHWVWGYSFLHQRPILVPELLAYYSLGCGGGFVYETSNGCALGGSLVEAIFHGILEVVERDAFLLTWYAQLPLPRLNLDSADDPELHLMVDRLRAATGYEIFAFDATMEHGIPSVWVLAKNTRRKGANLTCAAGAHFDPVRALKSAIHEISGTLLMLEARYEENSEACLRMYRDPYEVRHMEDHSMLYSLPQAEERLRFLLDHKRPQKTFADAFKPRLAHTDLTDDLKDLLQAFHRLQLDVIVIDQTTPELKRNGLYCVKVLIPGMLPMTFGYHLTRLEGLERVRTVPVQLGYKTQPLKRDELNPHPHPFP
jgi:ribosomal protein S12 methylthiotransferase accessory factor